jgi:hypothetical protein
MQTNLPGFAQITALDSTYRTQSLEKLCPKCLATKPIAEFPMRNADQHRPSSYCLLCQRIYSRAHYARNKKAHNERRRLHQIEYIRRNISLIAEHMRSRSCGESDPVVLEFDHVRGVKRLEISMMKGRGYSWQAVRDEIAKCEIRCANCHRRKTAIQLGWKVGRRKHEKSTGDGR